MYICKKSFFRFYREFGVQGTIGAIDCTHVAIMTPSSADTQNPQRLYMNRKGFYSVNVEAVRNVHNIFASFVILQKWLYFRFVTIA